jgi:hypothetical protein
MRVELAMKHARIKTDTAYHDIIRRIEAICLLDDVNIQRDFIHKLNDLFKDSGNMFYDCEDMPII